MGTFGAKHERSQSRGRKVRVKTKIPPMLSAKARIGGFQSEKIKELGTILR